MRYYLTVFLALFWVSTFGQIAGATSKIATIARYTSSGVELRWMPDNKSVLRLGFDHSYTIERSDFGAEKYVEIAVAKSLSKPAWEGLIVNEKDTATKTNLEIAMEFLFVNGNTEKKALNLDSGIADLNEQKSKEEMIYALFVLTAIKNGKAAEALGLGFIDKSAVAGKTYHYRIRLNAKSPIYLIEEGKVDIKAIVDPNRYKNEVLVFPGDKRLSFAWTSNPQLAGYFVERAAVGDVKFKALNTTPFYDSKGAGFEGVVNGSFDDDSLTNYKWYRYRFYGQTSFGEKILFSELKGMPKDLTPPEAPLLKLKHTKPKEVSISWEMRGNLSDLKGFIISRAEREDGDFSILNKTLLPAMARGFKDTGFNLETNNYYIVYAMDTAGNISASYPGYVTLVDSIPPAKPQIASAIVDSLGVVTLTIKQGKEKDLKGYRIYKSNSAEHDLSVVQESFRKDKLDSNAIKLVFLDTVSLNSSTPKIYYRIKALDFNYNQSIFSDLIAVKRPDTIPPITPVFTNVIVKEKQIELYFAPSESLDVKEHIIYRKTELKDSWVVLNKITALQKQFIDTAVKTNINYYYSIRAMDEGKLYSDYAQSVYGKPFETGLRPPVTDLTISLQNKKVAIKWNYPALKSEVFFVIYKRNSKGDLQQYAKIKEKFFTDEKTEKENSYAIKAITADGGQSHLSTFISQKSQ